MVSRLCLAAGLLLVACGGNEGTLWDSEGQATVGGTGAAEAGSAGQAGAPVAGSSTAGQGGAQEPAGGSGGAPVAGSAGEPTVAGQGGTEAGASSGGAAGSAGGGAAGSGQAGGAQGGSSSAGAGGGGKPSDLDPKPVPGCEGYVAVTIPHATCVVFRGEFAFQNKECNVADPESRTCAVASAPGVATTTIVSSGAMVERYDFGASGCPKSCP